VIFLFDSESFRRLRNANRSILIWQQRAHRAAPVTRSATAAAPHQPLITQFPFEL